MVEERVYTGENLPALGADFNAATLKRLSDDFKGLSPEAASALTAFEAAAAKVRVQYKPAENGDRLSILNRLPSREHMVALRAFEKAKEALFDVDSNGLGVEIALQTEKSFIPRKS